MSSTFIIVMIIFGLFSVSGLLKCKCFGDDENQLIMKLFSRLIDEETNSCAPPSDRSTYWRASWCGCDPGCHPVGSWSVTRLSVCDRTTSGERWSRLPGVCLLKPSRSIRRDVRSGVHGEPELWLRSVGFFCSLMRECRGWRCAAAGDVC